MDTELIRLIEEMNPWLTGETFSSRRKTPFIERKQAQGLLSPDWDALWLVLVGPRRAGKTTLGVYIAQQLIEEKRFESLLYLNCDFPQIRKWIQNPIFIREAIKQFQLKNPIVLLDEVQRMENPGLLLKGIIDLRLPVKLMTTGSSELELKSKVQEFLTGRQLEVKVFPLSFSEIGKVEEEQLIYGLYPEIFRTKSKEILLRQLFEDYIAKDIIEILKIGKPDIMRELITLLAHSSGQLVNYNQLSKDCKASVTIIQQYCSILERTYIVQKVKPFTGNKRKEVVSNPIYYFIDNGFRNQALRRFGKLDERDDTGLLIEGAVFQELIKFREHHFYDFDLHYWRTLSGAEVDFVLYKNEKELLPIEVKYRSLDAPTIPRSLHSFLDAYNPKHAIMITKNFVGEKEIKGALVHFLPFSQLLELPKLVQTGLNLKI